MPRQRKKKWRPIANQDDLRKVAVGMKIQNRKTGEEFEVVKVGGIVDGVLQIEARPLSLPPSTFEFHDGKWRFA